MHTPDDVIKFKKRRHARKLVTRALKKGELVKPPSCTLCFVERKDLEAHHVDYGRPLAVTWLCKDCHGLAHKKGHRLNPENNPQTPNAYLHDCQDLVQVTVLVPMANFVTIHAAATKKKVSISKLLKEQIIKDYPRVTDQLEFKFEDKKKNDQAQNVRIAHVRSVEAHKEPVQQPEKPLVQELWSERDKGVPTMGEQLYMFSFRNGTNATILQRSRAA